MLEYLELIIMVVALVLIAVLTCITVVHTLPMNKTAEKHPYLVLMERRHKLLDSFLSESVPRLRIPKHFINANRPGWSVANLIGVLFTLVIINALLWWFILTGGVRSESDPGSGFMHKLFWSLVILTHSIAPTVFVVAMLWWRNHGTRKRKKLLQDGVLVEGTVGGMRPTGKTGRNPAEKQYKVYYTYCWQGVNRDGSQLLYSETHFLGFDFINYDKSLPVRLLVDPENLREVLWADATLLSNALAENSPDAP